MLKAHTKLEKNINLITGILTGGSKINEVKKELQNWVKGGKQNKNKNDTDDEAVVYVEIWQPDTEGRTEEVI